MATTVETGVGVVSNRITGVEVRVGTAVTRGGNGVGKAAASTNSVRKTQPCNPFDSRNRTQVVSAVTSTTDHRELPGSTIKIGAVDSGRVRALRLSVLRTVTVVGRVAVSMAVAVGTGVAVRGGIPRAGVITRLFVNGNGAVRLTLGVSVRVAWRSVRPVMRSGSLSADVVVTVGVVVRDTVAVRVRLATCAAGAVIAVVPVSRLVGVAVGAKPARRVRTGVGVPVVGVGVGTRIVKRLVGIGVVIVITAVAPRVGVKLLLRLTPVVKVAVTGNGVMLPPVGSGDAGTGTVTVAPDQVVIG